MKKHRWRFAAILILAGLNLGCRTREREILLTRTIAPEWVLPEGVSRVTLEEVPSPEGDFPWAGKVITEETEASLSRLAPRIVWSRGKATDDPQGWRLVGKVRKLRVINTEHLERIRRYQDGDLQHSYEVQIPVLARKAEIQMEWRLGRGGDETGQRLNWSGTTGNLEEEDRRRQRMRMAQLTGEQAGFSGRGGLYADPLPSEEELVARLAGRSAQALAAKLTGDVQYGRLRFFFQDDLIFRTAFDFLERGDLTAARGLWETAIRQEDRTGYAHHNLGLLLEWQRDWEGAASQYRLALNLGDQELIADCAEDLARVEKKRAGKIEPTVFP